MEDAHAASSRTDPRTSPFTRHEWARLGGFYGFIAVLHGLGWGLYLQQVAAHPSLVGLGLAAYLFGWRHAFDVDHVAAVDDTVRYLMQRGERPLGIGFFFSLGHSTVVLLLAIGIAVSAAAVKADLPALQAVGGPIGSAVSGLFLCVVGVLNLFVLADIVGVWRQARRGAHRHARLDALPARRGLLDRLTRGRLKKLLRRSWHMYPLGLLFGLGFDTASEVALLAMTAGASTGDLPVGALLSLPILFAAGMTLMDTTDGVLMAKACDWARVDPLRKIRYNLTITSLSVAIALVIGPLELLRVLIGVFDLRGEPFDRLQAVDFGLLGIVLAGSFVVGWGLSVVLWNFDRLAQRSAMPRRSA